MDKRQTDMKELKDLKKGDEVIVEDRRGMRRIAEVDRVGKLTVSVEGERYYRTNGKMQNPGLDRRQHLLILTDRKKDLEEHNKCVRLAGDIEAALEILPLTTLQQIWEVIKEAELEE